MHCLAEMPGSACFCLLPLPMERRCVMNILNWREHADNFFDDPMLVMAVIVTGVSGVFVFTFISRLMNAGDRRRPH